MGAYQLTHCVPRCSYHCKRLALGRCPKVFPTASYFLYTSIPQHINRRSSFCQEMLSIKYMNE